MIGSVRAANHLPLFHFPGTAIENPVEVTDYDVGSRQPLAKYALKSLFLEIVTDGGGIVFRIQVAADNGRSARRIVFQVGQNLVELRALNGAAAAAFEVQVINNHGNTVHGQIGNQRDPPPQTPLKESNVRNNAMRLPPAGL